MVSMNKHKQSGSVSLFIVVLTAMLITIITVSFVRIMILDQQQASSNDLSQSAYDSAQAGVEDAKRALLLFQTICNNNLSDCAAAANAIDSSADGGGLACNKAVQTLKDVKAVSTTIGSNVKEVKVQTNASGDNQARLDQAYTCLKIYLKTDNYLGNLINNESDTIPLIGTGAFDVVQIQWFGVKDVKPGEVVLAGDAANPTPLLYNWDLKQPPVLRAQFIQIANTGFDVTSFDASVDDNGSNTLFLYPSAAGLTQKNLITADIRRQQTSAPQQILCANNFISYSCMVQIKLPKLISSADHSLFLRLNSIFNSTDYQITLYNSNNMDDDEDNIKFNGVQPLIDSTGRANDYFRRVLTRVELTDGSFPYPQAEIDISGNFCKNISVTNIASEFNMDAFDSSLGASKCKKLSLNPPPVVPDPPDDPDDSEPDPGPDPDPPPDEPRFYPY